jgi:hypothetical protein
MDKDRIEGAAAPSERGRQRDHRQGDRGRKTQAEGAAEKAAGKVQNTVGGAKDAVRDTLKK